MKRISLTRKPARWLYEHNKDIALTASEHELEKIKIPRRLIACPPVTSDIPLWSQRVVSLPSPWTRHRSTTVLPSVVLMSIDSASTSGGSVLTQNVVKPCGITPRNNTRTGFECYKTRFQLLPWSLVRKEMAAPKIMCWCTYSLSSIVWSNWYQAHAQVGTATFSGLLVSAGSLERFDCAVSRLISWLLFSFLSTDALAFVETATTIKTVILKSWWPQQTRDNLNNKL